MPYTFASANPTHHGGKRLSVAFSLNAAGALDPYTRTVSIFVHDLSNPANPAQVTRLDKGDIQDALNEVENSRLVKNEAGTVLTLTLDPTFNGVRSKKVKLTIVENQVTSEGVATEQNLLTSNNSVVVISAVPSAPGISLVKAPTFTVNNAGAGVVVSSGTLRFTISSGESTKFVKVIAKGTDASGEAFVSELTTSPRAVAADAKYVDVALTSSVLPALAHEKQVHFLGVSENSEGESDPSVQVSFTPSLRLAAPKLNSARSCEDRKITVYGSANLPVRGTSFISILMKAQRDHDEDNLPLECWKTTEWINIPFTPTSNPSFKKEVRQMTGSSGLDPVPIGFNYWMQLIHHLEAIAHNESHPLDPESPTNTPVLTQSLGSNLLSAVCCAYPADNVDLNVDSQFSSTEGNDKYLTFAPSITNLGGLPADLCPKFTFIASGVAKTQINDTGDYTVPSSSFYKCKNPVKNAKYQLSLQLTQALSAEAAKSITGESAVPLIVRDGSTHAVVRTFDKEVEENPSAADIPQVSNFDIVQSNVAGKVVMFTQHTTPSAEAYALAGMKLLGFKIEACAGIAGSPQDSAYATKHRLSSSGDTSLFVSAVAPFNTAPGSDYADAGELNPVKVYNTNGDAVDLAGYQSIRIAVKVLILKTNTEMMGAYMSKTTEVQRLSLPSPQSVVLAPYTDAAMGSDSAVSKMKVLHVTVSYANMTGLPKNWSDAKAMGAEVKLVDQDGNDVDGAYASKQFTDAEQEDAFAGAVASSNIFTLRNVEGRIFRARARHQFGRLSAQGDLLSDRSFGSWTESSPIVVQPKLKIASVLVKTSPVSVHPSGRDAVGMDTLSVEVKLDIGKLAPSGARITAFLPGTGANGVQYMWQMDYTNYNLEKKQWSITIPAAANQRYDAPIYVVAQHPDAPNADAKSI